MASHFQYLLRRLQEQLPDHTVRYSIRKTSSNYPLFITEHIRSLPAATDVQMEKLYVIHASDLPGSSADSFPMHLICIEDIPAPDWLCKSQFSIIFLPDEDMLALVKEWILEFDRDERRFSAYTGMILDALSRGQGLRALCDLCCELFQNPVSILDTGLKALAVPTLYVPKTPFLRAAWERGYSDETDIRFLKKKHWFDAENYTKRVAYFPHESFEEYKSWEHVKNCYVGYVRVNSVVVGYLLICGENTPLKDYQESWVRSISQVIALELQKTTRIQDLPTDLHEALLIDLLSLQIADPDVIRRRFEMLGMKLGKDLQLLVVKQSGAVGGAIPESTRMTLRDYFPKSLSAYWRNKFVILIDRPFEGLMSETKATEFNQFLFINGLSVGISNQFHDRSKVSCAYHQAQTAIRFGNNLHGFGRIFNYADYTIFYAIDLCAKSAQLAELCHPAILTLFTSSDPSSQDMYQTLFLYLQYMKDVNRVCEELHIHRSTIFYRLNKLKNEYGLDLDDGDVVLQLMFSYKILQYYESDGSYRKEIDNTLLN